MIGISGSLIWSKTLMELTFNSYGEIRWSPEGPVPNPLSPPPRWCPWDLFTSFKVCSDAKERDRGAESNGKLPHLFYPWKIATLVPEFAVEDLPSAEQQTRLLRLQWGTCPWAEHSDDYDNEMHKGISVDKEKVVSVFWKCKKNPTFLKMKSKGNPGNRKHFHGLPYVII